VVQLRALVKGEAPDYDEVIPENMWGDWTRANLNYYTECYGYTLIEEYIPPEPEA